MAIWIIAAFLVGCYFGGLLMALAATSGMQRADAEPRERRNVA